VKGMLMEWEKNDVSRVERIFKSIQNVSPSQLADRELFDFVNLPLDRQGERSEYDYDEATIGASNINDSSSATADIPLGVQIVETVQLP